VTDYSTQIDQIKQANSLEEIRDVSRQFSAKAIGEGGILYSRPVGSVNSDVIALELAKRNWASDHQ
jgi:hypothetical protein